MKNKYIKKTFKINDLVNMSILRGNFSPNEQEKKGLYFFCNCFGGALLDRPRLQNRS